MARPADDARPITLVLVGVLSASAETQVMVVDTSAGRSSGWTQLGKRFGEYVLESYDVKTEVLKVTLGGRRYQVHLTPDAKIIDSGTSVQVGNIVVSVFANTVRPSDDGSAFDGDVAAIAEKFQISAERAHYDRRRQTIDFEGSVRIRWVGTDNITKTTGAVLKVVPHTGEPGLLIPSGRATIEKASHKAPEPTPGSVTPRAIDPKAK